MESSINGRPRVLLSAAEVRERLAHTRLPADPLKVTVPVGIAGWPAELQRKLISNLTPAGVLIPLIERDQGLSVLLTERAADLKHHAGQISFPGGRMEHSDADIRATALRETHEEVGIEAHQVEVAGYLDPAPTVTGYAVTPVVGLVDAKISLSLDRKEVAEAFEVPLSFLMESRNQRLSSRDFEGVRVPVVEFRYRQWRIWGATASILLSLREEIISI